MTLFDILNFVAFASLAAAGIVPLLITFKTKFSSIRILSLLLGAFAMSHGLYHLSFVYGQDLLGEVVLEPLSVAFLLGFGLYYSKKGML